MKRIVDILQKGKWHIFFWCGLAAAMFSCLAYFVLGTGSYVQIHDQLDGEVLNYIYRAKYLFSGNGVIPEFMNGMRASSMTPPSPLGVLFYKLLPPFWAYALMHVFVIAVGYVGCFLLIKLITQNPCICFVTACLFVYLPFYPVYGLSILGQPMLVWALWQIYRKKTGRWPYYFCVFLYAAGSSLALIGYAWIILLALVLLVMICKHKPIKGMGTAFLVLCATYLACNLQLVGTIIGIGGASYSLHREEMVITPETDFLKYFLEIFLEGGSYASAYNAVIAIMAIAILILYPLIKVLFHKKACSAAYRLLAVLFGLNMLIAGLTCMWRTPWFVEIRMTLGGMIKYFQADRICWLLPLCWYVILALCLSILLTEWKKARAGRYLLALAAVCLLGNTVYENSTIYHNLRLMIFPDTYHLMNWDDFYAVDVFEQIDEFIGEEKESYRTVSLGLTPAAALYNGFYCLDGYSNMYSLEYKHEFRKIIEKELDKNEAVRLYFDNWGNRCYLLNSETGNYVLIDKGNGGAYENLELNVNQMYDMGARYLFSAMPIENAEELGLKLMRETPFSTEESYFEVWLYGIENAGE